MAGPLPSGLGGLVSRRLPRPHRHFDISSSELSDLCLKGLDECGPLLVPDRKGGIGLVNLAVFAPKGVHFSHERCYLLLKHRHPRISVEGRVHYCIESQSNGRVTLVLVETFLAGVGRAAATPGIAG